MCEECTWSLSRGEGSWILPSSIKSTTSSFAVGGPPGSSSLHDYLRIRIIPCSCLRRGILETPFEALSVRSLCKNSPRIHSPKITPDVPGNAFTHSLLQTSYDWNYKTVVQPNANNRQLIWPRGKVLGGSSAVNGLYLVRPSKIEYDTWSNLMSTQDNGAGAQAWNWDNHYPFMKKSETYSPPVSDVQSVVDIQYNTDNHGNSGPLHASYPG
jgi:choline dehydrogenase-like flavoprotein